MTGKFLWEEILTEINSERGWGENTELK